MKCKICGNENRNREFKVKEMMFGLNDEFTYFECALCGCLQIKEIPPDINRYYPSGYYSFAPLRQRPENLLKNIAKRLRDEYVVSGRGVVGKLIHRRFCGDDSIQSLACLKLGKKSRILDIGCGAGKFLATLKELGFNNLMGVDPYIDKNINYDGGLAIVKNSIFQVQGLYDLITFHHSFEHITDPFETLRCANNLMANGAFCLIRIPVADSWAWEKYGVDWAQIDAPRHFFIHTRQSMANLAEKTGFKIENIVCDSSEFQFYASEQYKKGIPLTADNSYGISRAKSIFTKKDIRSFKDKAKKLNSAGKGDQASFYLKKIDGIS